MDANTTTLTITEALAEVKTLASRIESKREFIYRHLVRQEGMKDPLAAEGGSTIALEREEQAIADLEARLVTIRRAIQTANSVTTLSLEGATRSIADWIVWRREIAGRVATHLTNMVRHIEGYRKAAQQKGVSLVAVNGTPTKDSDLLVNVDERRIADQADRLERILGALDGKLSHLNATTSIQI